MQRFHLYRVSSKSRSTVSLYASPKVEKNSQFTVSNKCRVSHQPPSLIQDETRTSAESDDLPLQEPISNLSFVWVCVAWISWFWLKSILLFLCLYNNGIAPLRLEMWGRGICQRLFFFFFSLDCAAPPFSWELVSNEMEMFSGLPGAGPVLCSTDNVAAPPVGVWPFYATWQQ